MSDKTDQMADIAAVAGAEFFGDDFVDMGDLPEDADAPIQIDSNDRARDEQGRFTSLSESTAVGAVEEAGEAAEPVVEPVVEGQPEETPGAEAMQSDESGAVEIEIDDEEVLAFLERYDGDVVAALRGATEAQKTIGRQGNELHEYREQMEEALDERLGAMQREIIAQTIDWGDQIESNPQHAADLALQVGNAERLVEALRAWEEEDGSANGPELFLRAAWAETTLAEQQQQQAPAEPAEDLAGVMTAFKAKNPDVQQYLPAIEKIAAERPTLAAALAQGSPGERALALEDALMLARSQGPAPDTSAAAKKLILRAKVAADKARADAVVETASNTSAATSGPSEDEVLQQDLRTLTGLDDLVVV